MEWKQKQIIETDSKKPKINYYTTNKIQIYDEFNDVKWKRDR